MKNEKLEKKIQMVHLQLTKRCNLNCWFCGQRKKNWDGAVHVGELGTEQWLEVAVQLNDLKSTGETLRYAVGRRSRPFTGFYSGGGKAI